ncbi:winged helix-turn-helix domain-containing protein [Caproiciproducens sp. R2]|uniref:winged helix-turn-helix domain-containing protein n=1 Tax=Caproiciproducens sp. R2 TaxID=3435187 RepID=UPI004033460C
MERKILYLTTEKELRTYMHPLRQRILFLLGRNKNGMTAKQLADALGVAPSSAGHHLAELKAAGLVELARTEKIHGFTAKFYRLTNVSVSLKKIPKEAAGVRRAVLQNHVSENFNRWADTVESSDESGAPSSPETGEFFSGTLYLSKRDMAVLNKFLAFCDAHAQPIEGTAPYEFTLFYARTGDSSNDI